MKRFKIIHTTSYDFSDLVQLLPHTLRLRPREGHELRIESSRLDITPAASLRWHRDIEGNSVATATFTKASRNLNVESEIIIQKYDIAPHDFLVADYAVDYPFKYQDEDNISLSPYINCLNGGTNQRLNLWVNGLWNGEEKIQTFALLLRINQHIFRSISYARREEEGVQSADHTLECGTGSCRDLASLFMAAAQRLGFAARFVSGYIYAETEIPQSGATHAWAEVLIPGAGWKGFDPTFGTIVGAEHIAVAVARRPELVPPIAGNFYGNPGSSMKVNVWVTAVS
ncbi:transglutaminase family protein [Alteromonadaceae bacterium BrNp21-10]|nr:transglutaminase family protein [Alteromonadaceae bacterium BrNp21-10]